MTSPKALFSLHTAILFTAILASDATNGLGDEPTQSWFRFRGPQLNGISQESRWQSEWPSTGPKVAWKANVGVGLSGIVVSGNRAITMGNTEDKESIVCLDVDDGKSLWQFHYDSPLDPNEFEGGPTSTPTIDGEYVYTLSRRGDVHCLKLSSGEKVWHLNASELANVRVPGWGFSGSPLVVDDLLLLNVGDAGLAVTKKDGKLVWASTDKDAGYSSMVRIREKDQDLVLFGSARSYVCIESRTGKERWRQRWLTTYGCNAADPIVRGDQVFLSTGYNRGCAMLKLADDDPQVMWKHKDMQNQLSTSVLQNSLIVGAHGNVDAGTKLRCLDWKTGDVKWTDESIQPGAISATPTHLIILTQDGDLVIGTAGEDGFQTTARHHVVDGKCWTAPVLSGGRIYCRTADGELGCLDVRQP